MNEEIYEKYSVKIYKYIYALCKDADVAEEVLQDTFYSAMKNIENFKENSSIYTWLCAIAKNNLKNYLNRKNKIKSIPLEEDIIDNSLIESLEDKQNVLELYNMIHKLDAITKEVILIKISSNLTFKEIGEMFGKSEQWAKSKFYRGKLKMKEELENE